MTRSTGTSNNDDVSAKVIAEPPRQCDGYPTVYLKHEPKEEVNFFLPIPVVDEDEGKGGVEYDTGKGDGGNPNKKNYKYLACSWITAVSTHSHSACTDKEARPSLSPSPSQQQNEKKKKGGFFSRTKKERIKAESKSKSSLTQPLTTFSPEEERRTTILNSIHRDLIKIDTSKEVIIICHGLLSWRNQTLIANLASLLSSSSSSDESSNESSSSDYHTLRFDFTGNGHSSGSFSFAPHQSDYDDLNHVVNFVTDIMNCNVCCIIGHSQGSSAILKHAGVVSAATEIETEKSSTSTNTNKKPLYVNLSGRCTRPNGFNPNQIFTTEQCRELELNGKFQFQTWSGSRMYEVTAQSINDRNAFDLVQEIKGAGGNRRIIHSRVLTIHGDNDTTVPIENAYMLDELISNHTMKIIQGANHNFNGLLYMNTIVSSILDFIETNSYTNTTT
eukprot:CAMPEP_0203676628 /NCGR_PEP_ID=MMETSP0090-20130426/25146_1 /ASSEMBLY_ACC=CAM_ASM_001088 /TAXON_ID=426623 /ORGANISM="Chaetoceros affinis, Strain CCMP159" /LENGTH=444 /DNA_ID=CAMNT_0050543221 /DNA_START=69 /DNA_END=1400 /DNA_ORIENTATION=+